MAAVESTELRVIAGLLVEAIKRRDPEEMAGYHAVDGVAESPMFATMRGRSAIEDAYRAFFTSFPDAAIEVDRVVVDSPCVVMFLTVNATHKNEFFGLPGTNRRIDFRMARLMTVNDDGLIQHEERIYDFTGLLVQVGLLRAKPAKP